MNKNFYTIKEIKSPMCFKKIVCAFLLISSAVYFWSCNLKFQESKSEIFNEQPEQLTGGPYRKNDPAWSPDGSKIAYSVLIGATELSTYSLAGKGTTTLARIEDDSLDFDFDLSPDGSKICFASISR